MSSISQLHCSTPTAGINPQLVLLVCSPYHYMLRPNLKRVSLTEDAKTAAMYTAGVQVS